MNTSNDCFVAALKRKLKEQGRGAKKKLAAGAGVSPNHLSDILAQRKNAGQKLKERIADILHMSFEDMLALGRHIAERQSETAGSILNQDNSSEETGEELLDPNDALAMAAEIISSDTIHSQALINTIVSLHQVLETRKKEKMALLMIHSLQKELKAMRLDIEELKRSEDGDRQDTAVA